MAAAASPVARAIDRGLSPDLGSVGPFNSGISAGAESVVLFSWTSFFLAIFFVLLWQYIRIVGKPRITIAPTSRLVLDGTIDALDSIHRTIFPPVWCFGGTLQIIYFLVRNSLSRAAAVALREIITTPDAGRVDLTWYDTGVPLAGADGADDSGRPVLFVMHGLMCDDADMPGTDAIAIAASRGWRCVCLNRRGHEHTPLRTPRFCILGDHRDVSTALAAIRMKRPKAPIIAMAISSGVTPLLRYLQVSGPRSEICAAVCVSGGVDASDLFHHCGFLYRYYFLDRGKQYFVRRHADTLRAADPKAYMRALDAPTCTEFYRALTPFAEDGSTEKDAFRGVNPVQNGLPPRIEVPTLFLNADDDPIVPQLCSDRWKTSFFLTNPNVCLVQTHSGSHCPFLEGPIHPQSWAMAAAAEFFEQRLHVQARTTVARGAAHVGLATSVARQHVGGVDTTNADLRSFCAQQSIRHRVVAALRAQARALASATVSVGPSTST